MIENLRFQNFKSLANVEMELEPFTVLVGPNAAGKTSLLEAAHLLSQAGVPVPIEHHHTWRRFRAVFGDHEHSPWRLATLPGAGPITMSMSQKGGDILSLMIDMPPPSKEKAHLEHTDWDAKFTLTVEGRQDEARLQQILPDDLRAGRPRDILDEPRLLAFASTAFLHLDASIMAQTSFVEEETPRMAANGHGLASTLAFLAGAQPEILDAIGADLATVIPGVRRIRTFRSRVKEQTLEPLKVEEQVVWRTVDHTRIGDRFAIEFHRLGNVASDLLSEGTILALGLITKIHEPAAPTFILLDDIDRGLHIEAQARLVDVLRRLMTTRPDLQIVCTTHSPYLLSRCLPSEVRVLALDVERHTRIRKLTDHPAFEKVKYGFQTGEIWASLGEDWVGGSTAK